MNRTALKIGVSAVAVGLVMVGCTAGASDKMLVRTVAEAPDASRADQLAARKFALAQGAVERGDTSGALVLVEESVALAPRDAGYRMLLADLYLKMGRFNSAEAAFSDVLRLDAANARAMFNLALVEIALGRKHSALLKLDLLSQSQSTADLGLAYALAGFTDRAVSMLEVAARAPEAGGRVRQNLALAYAMAGDWQRARLTASQDLSPADVAGRMEEWARFVQPAGQADQVASLFGVTPASDPGQPRRLALAPAAEERLAMAEAAPPAPTAVVHTAAEIVEPALAQIAEPLPAAVQQQAEAKPTAQRKTLAAPIVAAVVRAKPAARPKTGRFVVQLASYNSAAALEQGWAQIRARYRLGNHMPVGATVNLPGKGRFHRLSLGGFGSQAEAAGACRSIRAKGGACFARAAAGDAPVRFASRGAAKGRA